MKTKKKAKKEKGKRRSPASAAASASPKLQPDVPALIQQALQQHRAGKVAAAKIIYQQILTLDPENSDALNLLGAAELQQGRAKIAETLLQKAIARNPNNAVYHSNLGAVYQALHQPEAALTCFQQAYSLKPDFADAIYNIGAVLIKMGKSAPALEYFEKSITFNPNNADAYLNIGMILKDQEQFERSLEYYHKALRLKPDYGEAYYKMGVAYRDQGKVDEAIDCYRQAIAVQPTHHIAFSRMIHLLQYRCDWAEVAELSPKLDDITRASDFLNAQTAETPFENLTRHDTPGVNLPLARSWAMDVLRKTGGVVFPRRTSPLTADRLTIGYLSNDFRHHPVGYLIQGLFQHHDRQRFRIHAYSFGKDDASECRKQIQAQSDSFVDISAWTDRQAAEQIHADGVDILVDLMGYTGGSRLDICAHKPAPLCVNYLGYPGTTGADFMDYIIGDPIVTPPTAASHYAEKLVIMPHAYLVTNNRQPLSRHGWGKINFGLPENGFVFCSFNAQYKLEPVMFRVWLNILQRVPNSVLWLANAMKIAKENLRAAFREAGIAKERLIFAKRLDDKAEHLERLGAADLVLDTRIYNGHASTCDALWAGVPALTCPGGHFPSRVAASLLMAIGLPELVVDNLQAFEDLAVRLALDSLFYQHIRQRLAQNRLSQPLFNTPRYVRNLEQAYIQMWERYQQGKPADLITVADASPPTPAPVQPPQQSQIPVPQWLEEAAGLHRAGQFAAAAEKYSAILQVMPQHPDALHLLGLTAYQRGDLTQAQTLIQQAIAVNPKVHWYYGNLGLVWQARGKLSDAIANYQTSLTLNPDYLEGHNNLGTAYKDAGDVINAEACYHRAIALRADYAVAYYNLGILYQEQQRPEDSARYLLQALAIQPNYEAALAILTHQLQHLCDWEKLAHYGRQLDQFTAAKLRQGAKPEEKPFESLVRRDNPALNLEIARAWSREAQLSMAAHAGQFAFPRPDPGKQPLIIGYVSKDFRNHAVGHLIRGLFPAHNRQRFRVYAYSYGDDDGSRHRRQIQEHCDQFVDIQRLDLLQAARRIHQDGVDILVNLMSFTGGRNIMGLFALKPAPLQVSWLGYPGTSGADYLDYILTDKIVTPLEHIKYYSEKPIFLPHSYQINDDQQPFADVPGQRRDFGLPQSGLVFCAFSQHYKIEPPVFAAWMRLLQQIPDSVLWLIHGNSGSRQNLTQAARQAGVDPARLIFAPMLPKPEHLTRHRLADLALDTLLVNGHTTTSDALWAGVPVITCWGKHFASRVSASLLTAVGLPELITDNLADYEALALKLAQRPEALAGVKQKLAENRARYPLFQTRNFVAGLEIAYQTIWGFYAAGRPAAAFEINTPSQPPSPPPFSAPQALAQALKLHQDGQLEAAEAAYQRILAQTPNNADALNLSGVLAYQQGRHEIAQCQIEAALRQNPHSSGYHNNLGLVYQAQGFPEKAAAAYQQALTLDPDTSDTYNNLGNSLKELGRRSEAAAAYQQALVLKPDYPEALFNLGNLYREEDRLPEAIAALQRALALKSNYIKAHNILGVVFRKLGRYDESLACYQTSLALNPHFADTYNNLANLHTVRGDSAQALQCYQKALELEPNSAQTLNNLGNELKLKDPLKAYECFQNAVRLKPNHAESYCFLVTQLRLMCRWSELAAAEAKLNDLIQRQLAQGLERVGETPFISIIRHADPALNQAVAASWSNAITRKITGLSPTFSAPLAANNQERLTLGYLSNDFRNHPVGHILAGLFRRHDRRRFIVHAYSYGPDDGSRYRQQIMADCDRFVDVRRLSFHDAALAIHQDQVDIVIDLMGYTTDSRIEISAFRPAPLQVSYLGFPGTTGASFFDYIITDKTVTPERDLPYYTEQPVFMPHSYMFQDETQPISDRPMTRREFCLPASGLVFACFNAAYKLDPETFALWLRILSQVPDSVLWFGAYDQVVQVNLRREAEQHGVNPQRLIFSQRLEHKDQHLARLRLADLMFDTRSYNGHVSTLDALWAGVPVLTQCGTHFASRVAAGLLTAAELPELITESETAFEQTAVHIARHPQQLAELRQKLAQKRGTAPLFNLTLFVRSLEQAYLLMWKRWQTGLPPAPLEVANPGPME